MHSHQFSREDGIALLLLIVLWLGLYALADVGSFYLSPLFLEASP